MKPTALSGDSAVSPSRTASGGLRCRVLRIGRRHRVVLAPTPGNGPAQVLELLMGLRLASSLRAPLWLLASGESATPSSYEMSAEGPEIEVISGWRAKLLEWLVFLPRGRRITTAYGSVRDFAIRRGPRQPSAALEKDPKPARAVAVYVPPYYKRLWLDSAPQLAVPADRIEQLQSALDQLGVGEGARLVALHVRGSASGPAGPNTLEAYRPTVAWLGEQGFVVVRVGESDGPPLDWPGMIDLASVPDASEMLRLHCIARAAFLITNATEISAYGWAFRTPVLTVNAVDYVGSFPVRERDMFTVRRVLRRADGRILPLGECFIEDLAGNLVEGHDEYLLVDNTPDEVLAAVQDMAGTIEGRVSPETPEQREFRFLATRAGMLRSTRPEAHAGYGPHHCYLGRGRMAASFARASLSS